MVYIFVMVFHIHLAFRVNRMDSIPISYCMSVYVAMIESYTGNLYTIARLCINVHQLYMHAPLGQITFSRYLNLLSRYTKGSAASILLDFRIYCTVLENVMGVACIPS